MNQVFRDYGFRAAMAGCLGFVLVVAPSGARAADGDSSAPRQISGIYPHLTTYGDYSSPDGAFTSRGRAECGIGAVVPWAGRLWMINYAPHAPHGSEHKLYSVDSELNLTIHPESVGGTPAARMIHRESNQLLIGPYLIDAEGQVRVIPPSRMPGRLTAIARHLHDPESWVYYFDMEGMLYEANVRTLEVRKLFDKPVPGWHGKGAYTAQGRLVIANNGESAAGGHSYDSLVVEDVPPSPENAGVLAEWDGDEWNIVERRQFTDVTGPGGIEGNPDDEAPLWSIGWDRRSLRLKLLDDGRWSTFLLPKAQHNNDPRHGWYTEWPRIRPLAPERAMMDMHGMFFDFPLGFSADATGGIRPLASHLRYIPDFCVWDGRLVLATDGTSIQGNPLAGQPQSNLWFGDFDDLQHWGPRSGWGGPWVGDAVEADQPSDPFLVAGFAHRTLHLAVGAEITDAARRVGAGPRTSNQFAFDRLPKALSGLPIVTIERGDWHEEAPGYRFEIDRDAIVYLAVDRRGDPELGDRWEATDMTLTWGGGNYADVVFKQRFAAGVVEVPGNTLEHQPGSFGMPHTAFIAPVEADGEAAEIELSATAERLGGQVHEPRPMPTWDEDEASEAPPVRFTLEIDPAGDGAWRELETVAVADGGYLAHRLPGDLAAEWMRLRPDRDCRATAYFHFTDDAYPAREPDPMFSGLAAADADQAHAALLFAARDNRNLRVLPDERTPDEPNALELTKGDFTFREVDEDPELRELLRIEPEYTIDEASVVLDTGAGRLRLPKGSEALERLWNEQPWRAVREVQSERHLANIHGTFYEVPLISNGAPPVFRKMRPVSSHDLRIHDYCSWNGLLVLSGVRPDAPEDEHVFRSADGEMALWTGGVDDLWRLGKPVGRGGPWKETQVAAGEPSDPYLMTGFDRKHLTLATSEDATVRIEVDFDHQTGWHQFDELKVRGGEPLEYEFPDGFSAHWVRFVADRDCTATAWLEYR